jgi:hypothetical protein
MFGSSLPPVVCRRAHVLFTLFVFVSLQWCPTHNCVVFLFCFPSSCVPYICCQFLWIVLFWSPLPYSLIFIYSSLILQLFVKTGALVTLADFVYLFRSLGYITNNIYILTLLLSIMITFKRESENERALFVLSCILLLSCLFSLLICFLLYYLCWRELIVASGCM